MVFKSGVQLIGNCFIRLDPKPVKLFFSKNLKFVRGEFKEKTEKKKEREKKVRAMFFIVLIQTYINQYLF